MLGVSPGSGVARWFPEAMLRICPGYRLADGGESVARPAPPGKPIISFSPLCREG